MIGVIVSAAAQYTGTAHVSRGTAVTVEQSIYTCDKGRVAGIGRTTTVDGQSYLVPASTAWFHTQMPWASDLHNACNGKTYTTYQQAVAALDGSDIVQVDANGEVYTMFMFADNYAEVYINGVPVGKDRVPFTQFNSSIIRVRVSRPFTIAIRAVDWEEKLGVGVELNGGDAFHPGDGGLIVVLTDNKNQIVDVTNDTWKAQTFYTAPIVDLQCPSEQGSQRRSSSCVTSGIGSYPEIYALHWPVPDSWKEEFFDDTDWPWAVTYTPDEIGVNNKPAYTNFVDLFQRSSSAAFIWSSNLILDNEVIIRKRIGGTTDVDAPPDAQNPTIIYDPASDCLRISLWTSVVDDPTASLTMYDSRGLELARSYDLNQCVPLTQLGRGVYHARVTVSGRTWYTTITR